MRPMHHFIAWFLLALLFAYPAFANLVYTGMVIGVSDGDTIKVLHEGRPLKIRLAQIDAPEKSQPFGRKSK